MRTTFCTRYFAVVLVLAASCWLGGCRGLDTGSPNPVGGGSGGLTKGEQLPPTASPVQRIIVVILQNNTFDHLFGTFPAANGFHPGVPGYTQTDANGNSVSPFLLTTTTPANLPEGRAAYLKVWDNGLMDKFAASNGDQSMGYYDGTTPGVSTLWSYAQQFALADNYFSSVMSEAPTNQLYMVAAQDNGQVFPVQPDFGPCNKTDAASKPYSFPHVGDQLTGKSIDWEIFVENYGQCGNFVPQHDPFQYFVDTNNTPRIQDYSQFAPQMASATLPAVSFVIPSPAHDMHPGGGSVLAAANWLNNFIQQIQNSSLWANTAIVITWDTGGGWYDHVPPPQVDSQGLSFRVPLLVISPYAKKGYISHVQMDHVSILKFIQWNWNLGPLSVPRNNTSTDIRDMFQF